MAQQAEQPSSKSAGRYASRMEKVWYHGITENIIKFSQKGNSEWGE